MKKVKLGITVGLIILALVATVFITLKVSGSSIFETETKTNETQTITYLKKNKEIALVTLGITDIIDETNSQKIFGQEIPWSDKQTFIKATFEAKLGIDGKDVIIEKVNNNEYKITIPKFIFIGYDQPKIEHVVDNNGVLSFVTEDVNQAQMVNKMFSEENKEKYVNQYTDLLKESTEEFYNNLLPEFDKDVKLTFVYNEQ